jgi:hypothetical protein
MRCAAARPRGPEVIWCSKCEGLTRVQESGGFKAKEQIVRDVVARACSKAPSPATSDLERQEISLLRVPSRLTGMQAMPDIIEGETATVDDVSVRMTAESAAA